MIRTALVLWLLSGPALAAGPLPPPSDVAAPPADATKTPSGLAMKVLQPGRGKEHPRGNDCVKMHFTAWKNDGTFLSSSRTWEEPQGQCLPTALPGIAEALASMVVGEQRRVWVPPSLTSMPDDDHPSHLEATFDLELIEIVKAPPTPRDLKSPPASAKKMPSGLAIEILKKGKGTQHPLEPSQVKVDYSGWTVDGRLIESSVMGRHPAVFPMAGVIPGWHEALLRMVVGDKVRIWIPRDLAYGAKPSRGQPKGDLVYELALLEIQ